MRYAARRGRQEAWYVCDRARSNRGEPLCQAIAAPPVDEAIGMLIAEQITPAAIELAIEVRKRSKRDMKRRIGCAVARSSAPKWNPISPSGLRASRPQGNNCSGVNP
ncbi:hypothetical protein [Rhizobium sophoriradicis]|uniref:hypothetical protein n=1 Tax=Rhizobium sophoriradicis TaxID=1535245 RepID=UPI001FDEB58F|nr:hypothetical protein [Rhizobium sophoriradicis]